jgi:exoribonuclease-2
LLNALVAYKGKPARITNQTTHKFEILFEDGSTIKVREKDFRFIHPQFLNVENTEVSADFSILVISCRDKVSP